MTFRSSCIDGWTFPTSISWPCRLEGADYPVCMRGDRRRALRLRDANFLYEEDRQSIERALHFLWSNRRDRGKIHPDGVALRLRLCRADAYDQLAGVTEPFHEDNLRRTPVQMLRCSDRDFNGPLAFEGSAVQLQAHRCFIGSGHQDDARACFEHPGTVCPHLVKGESVRGMLDSEAPDTRLPQATEQACDHGGLVLAWDFHHPGDEGSGVGRGGVEILAILQGVGEEDGGVWCWR